ncbi:MAG: hypothetical protein B7Y61_16435, partial [Rhizobiales bacterium 35-66-30]
MNKPDWVDEDAVLDVLDEASEGEIDHEVVVPLEDVDARIDRVLAARLDGLSRTRIQRLVAEGRVTNGGRVVGDVSERVNAG